LLAVSGLAAVLLLVTLAASNVLIGREKLRADENYRASEANRRRAFETVHRYYTEVSEDLLLREPGLEPLRRRLLQNARQFYAEFVAEHGDDPDARAELGRALWRLANLTNEIDLDKTKAIELLKEARAIQEPLARDGEGASQSRSDLGKTLQTLGALHYDVGDLDAAAESYRRAQAIREELVRGDPGVAEYRDDLAKTYHNVGNLHRRLGKGAEAWAAFDHALTLRQQLVKEHPGDPGYQAGLALNHLLVGVLFNDLAQDQAKADEAYQAARKLFADLAAAYPRVTRYQHHLADTLQNLGALYQDPPEDKARDYFLESLTIRKKLASENPDVIDYQAGLARTHSSVAAVYSRLSESDEARKHFTAALEIQDKVGPKIRDLVFRRHWAATHNDLGLLYHQANRLDEAEQSYRRAIGILEELDRGKQELPEIALALGGFYSNVGTALRDAHGLEEALGWYDRAIQKLEAIRAKGRRDPYLGLLLRNTYSGRAVTRARTEDLAGARADAKKVEAEGSEEGLSGDNLYELARVYSLSSTVHPEDGAHAVAFLERARAAGHFKGAAQAEQLKSDPDLNALRSREDFQKLRRSLAEQY
jgi:tetratricopeptide (TPR) repeat protein